MKHVVHSLKLIVFLILFILVNELMLLLIGVTLPWVLTFSTSQMIWLAPTIGAFIYVIIFVTLMFAIPYISKINPYKTLGAWCAVLYIVVTLCIATYKTFTILDWSYTRSFILGLFMLSIFGYMLIFNITSLVASSEQTD
jgi:hypothetical protein